MYNSFKAGVLNKIIGDGQCVALVVNNSNAYVEALFPGVTWTNILPPVPSAYELAGHGNSYLTWIPNNHSDPNQVPAQGDIMVFDPTPQAGYTNQYHNPDGHTGICDSADSNGYNLLQQNAPSFGAPVNVTHYPWKFRPCSGWYHPGSVPPPPPAPAPSGHTITLPATTGPWHLYNVGGPYNPANPANVKGLLWPSRFGGLTYKIDQNLGNGIYAITTQDYGQGAIWTNGSSVIIN